MPSHHRLGILYLYLSNLVDSGGGDSDDSDGYFFFSLSLSSNQRFAIPSHSQMASQLACSSSQHSSTCLQSQQVRSVRHVHIET